ncbi:MAG: hypothetical protein EOO01_23875 [Chitinophagaceae bacterium]|nr:MAG: hypothetical protein EOO01_23875 [Chitinophagaceae bacterium]
MNKTYSKTTAHRMSWLALFFCTIAFTSCKDKAREALVVEVAKRMEGENKYLQKNNESLRQSLWALMNQEISGLQMDSLERLADSFHVRTDRFAWALDSLKTKETAANEAALFAAYRSFNQAYQDFKHGVTDSFTMGPDAENSTDFTNLDEEHFRQKYFQGKDKLSLHLRALLLQSDILVQERTLLKNVYTALSPFCNFGYDDPVAVAVPRKYAYSKGDSVEINVIVARLPTRFNGTVEIEGKVIDINRGVFTYKRKITEKPGTYEVSIMVNMRYGKKEIRHLPAKVSFEVR